MIWLTVFIFRDTFPELVARMQTNPMAAASKTFLELYLARRANLKLLVLLADSRREPLPSDAGVLEYAEDREDRPYKILMVATKVWFV